MQTEELLVKMIFNNQLAFCAIFGAFGGIVHVLDFRTKLTFSVLISKIIISSLAGVLLFFATYDISNFTPSIRIATAIVTGFYGSALFRYLSKFYLKQILDSESVDKIDDIDKEDKEEPKDDRK